MDKEDYTRRVSETYQGANPDDYGSAKWSTAEVHALREMYSDLQSEYPDLDRGQLKEIIKQHIVRHGWNTPDLASPELIGETGILHGCVVTETLAEVRGELKGGDTYFSYTTKNQWDRYVSMILIKQGKLAENGTSGQSLYEDWYSSTLRDPNYNNPKARHPRRVDSDQIYGIGKPSRYFPAQLMKEIESLRLGRDIDRSKLEGVTPTELSKMLEFRNMTYAIPWDQFNDIITKAKNTEDIAIGVALRVTQIYKGRNISVPTIATIILNGYNPTGPLGEHGNIPEVSRIWSRLLQLFEKRDGQLATELKRQLSQVLTSKGYKISDVVKNY